MIPIADSSTADTAPVKVPALRPAHESAPLAVRVAERRAELAAALAQLGPSEVRARGDLELAIASADALTTGDVVHPSDVVAASLSTWLEHNRHLGITAEPGEMPATD